MYGATMRPSSGEITVSMWYCLVCRVEGNSTLYTRQSSTLSDKYQVSHRYSYFSWWWAHSRPKHVEKRNKHIKKNCAPSWLYLQDYTRMHGQQNIKKRPHLFTLTHHTFIFYLYLYFLFIFIFYIYLHIHISFIKINLCCVRLNKCGLFSNKRNGMAFIKTTNIFYKKLLDVKELQWYSSYL